MKHDTDPTATRLGFGSVVDPAAPEPTPEPDPSATRLGFVLSEDPGHRPPEPRPPRRAPSEPRVIVVPEPAARGSGATHDTAGGEAFTAETLLPPDAAPGAPTGLFHQVDLALRDPDLCDTTLEPIHRRKAVQAGAVILGLGLLCVLAWTLAATDEAPMRIEQGATRAPGKKPEKQAPARVRPAVPPAPVVAPPGTPPRPTASATRPTASATRPTASATRPTASATRPTARATRPRIRTRRRRARPRHRRARPRLKVRYDRRANLVEITLPRESANARVVVKRGGEPTTR